MTAGSLPVWRSLLFVPVTARRFVDGAARRGADAITLDLEDSVAASEKERARAFVPEAAEIVSRGAADVVVRINRPLRLAVRDIETSVGPGVLALALPKVDSPEHVRLLAEIIDEVEAERGMAPGTTRLIAMVETAAAFLRIAEIARAHPRLCAQSGRRGLRIVRRDPARCRGALHAEADGRVRRARRRYHAIGVYRHPSPNFTTSTASGRRFGARAASASSAPRSSIRARSRFSTRNSVPARRKSTTPAALSPPTTRHSPRGCRRRHRRRQDDRRADRRTRPPAARTRIRNCGAGSPDARERRDSFLSAAAQASPKWPSSQRRVSSGASSGT
jgi:HpcH/HpaI aldolase/citrate lyase family